MLNLPKSTIAVLGCGPAGLMAAHAAALRGNPVVIFSKPVKSRLGGAQFLHRPIPMITGEDPNTVLTYRKRGDAETYRKKVYGDDPSVPFVSFDEVEDGQRQEAWSLVKAYDRLWEEFGHAITPQDVTSSFVESLADEVALVVSTVPLPSICRARAGKINEVHNFSVQDINVCVDPYVSDIENNTIWYDGTEERGWYRSSLILGVPGTEWSTLGRTPPVPTITDRKPIGTTCTCHPDVLRLGRRGTWTKGVLTHDAFYGALEFLG